jgi:iron complex outermembrane receptor protein
LNYVFNDKLTAFGNFSMASRQPAFKDIYDPTDYWSSPVYKDTNFTAVGGGYIYEGKTLKPERLFDLELGGGYKNSFAGNDLRAKLNFYYMQIKDEIIPYAGQVDDNNYPISGNADKTLHQGVELSARVDTRYDVSFFGNVSINDDHFVNYTEYGFDWDNWVPIEYDRSGNRIGGFPSMLGSYGVTYRYKPASVSLLGRFVGEQYLDNSEDDTKKLDAFHVVDLVTSVDIGDEFGIASMILFLRVNNVFDSKYVAAGYIEPDDGLPRYMVGAERNFFASIDLGL